MAAATACKEAERRRTEVTTSGRVRNYGGVRGSRGKGEEPTEFLHRNHVKTPHAEHNPSLAQKRSASDSTTGSGAGSHTHNARPFSSVPRGDHEARLTKRTNGDSQALDDTTARFSKMVAATAEKKSLLTEGRARPTTTTMVGFVCVRECGGDDDDEARQNTPDVGWVRARAVE